MANTFLTSNFVQDAAGDAAVLLQANLVASRLTSRDLEGRLADGVPTVGKAGGTVDVKVVPVDTANEQDHRTNAPSTLSLSDVVESSVTVDARNYFYIKKQLDVKEKTFELDDFNKKYTVPAMAGLAQAVDNFFIKRIVGGFSRNVSGTAGTAASTTTHILNARKVMQDNLAPQSPRVGLIGTTVERSFLGIDQFTNRDYGEDGASNLRQAALSTRYGIDWFVDQNVSSALDFGDIAGTVLSNGAASGGETTQSIDGFTTATGYVREGTRFVIAGDATVYTVTEDAVKAGNAATVSITPAVVTGWTDGAAVTFETAHTEDVIFHPGMVAGAIIAPTPLFLNSSVGSFDNLSVRISFESSSGGSSGAVDTVLFDTYCGCKVIRPEGGVIMQG